MIADKIFSDDIKIQEVQHWMDGGSITIRCIDSDQQKFTIEFHQHVILKTSSEGKMPGRIYLNNKLIKERSTLEGKILFLLEKAILKKEDQLIIREKINYVKSKVYLENNKQIQNQRLEFYGQEFDWFAIDRDGKYGLFSSAGSAVIPMNVIEDYKSHDAISKQMKLPNYGSEKVWSDFPEYGVYVFDFHLHKGPYLKKSEPISEVPEKIINGLTKLRSLVKFEISFSAVNKIIID